MSVSDAKEVGYDAVAGAAFDVGVHDLGRDAVGPTLGGVVLAEVVLWINK